MNTQTCLEYILVILGGGGGEEEGGTSIHIYLYFEEKVRGIGEICQQQGNHFNLVSDRII